MDIKVCLDPNVSVALGDKDQMIMGLYFAIRTANHFVNDRYLLDLTLKAAVQCESKHVEDEIHYFNNVYMPKKRVLMSLSNEVVKLEGKMKDEQVKRIALQRKIAKLKQGSLDEDTRLISIAGGVQSLRKVNVSARTTFDGRYLQKRATFFRTSG